MKDNKEVLKQYRTEIDQIDDQIAELFQTRMNISREVAKCKSEHNIAITDNNREQQIVERMSKKVDENIKGEMTLLIRSLMALSKGHQRKMIFDSHAITFPEPKEAPKGELICAFQGVSGAWGEIATINLFPEAKTTPMEYFEDVFKAVRSKKAHYGILPIENSQTGAIGEVYDLLREYGLYIVGQTWVSCNQCLIAPKGMDLADVREVFSHPQGFMQCHNFLKNYHWDQSACRNTAVAAQTVVSLNNGRTAAIGSRRAAELNNLDILVPDIMDSENNKTRFVVIAEEPQYDANSDIVSIAFSTSHRSGALLEALLPFMAAEINLSRIESRPAIGGKYRFFTDLTGNVKDEKVMNAILQASAACEYLEIIGCFSTR